MRHLVAACLCAAALAGCATPTTFGPIAGPGASGFWETRIDTDRYRVSYRGGSGAPPDVVRNYALLHAADLTLADGYDWFQIVGRYGAADPPRTGSSLSVGGGSSSYGRHSVSGVGVGFTVPLDGGPQLTETIEVVMGKGVKPDRPGAFDARGVRQSLRPTAPAAPVGPPLRG